MPVHDLSAARQQAWLQSRLVRETIEASGAGAYVKSLSNLSDAFRPGDRALRCIDGRTPGGVHLAGSGILLGLAKAKVFAETAGAAKITYHDDCGAARLWAQGNGRAAEEATICAREFAEQLAAALGLPCEQTPLVGVPGFHDEAVIYYDGTGKADPSRVSGLPKGFVISRPYFGEDFPAALDQVKLVTGIALGEHGFGDLFTPEHPLRLIAIGDPQNPRLSLEQLLQELALAELPSPNRLALDGFIGR
jgi:hypothetical protein